MSHRRHQKKRVRPAKGPGRSGARRAQPASGRIWCFRLVTAIGFPLLLLFCAELILRWAGVGYDPHFFLSKELEGRPGFVDNQDYARRFFPFTEARSPTPIRMAARKDPAAYRIFLMGESAALGDPNPAYGMGRHLEVLLEERFPARDFEVVCVAMTAINSPVVRDIARECMDYDGDCWVVYMGNNEMVGPYGAATAFGAVAPPLWMIRTAGWVQQFRFGQWMAEAVAGMLGGKESSWSGMRAFAGVAVAPDDPRKERVYRHFERNLRDVVRSGLEAGVEVILSTVAVNLRDCAPFASRHASAFPQLRDREFQELLLRGAQLQAAEKVEDSIKPLEAVVRMDPRYAEGSFRLAQSRFFNGEVPAAQALFSQARDDDALPFRADSRVEQITRSVAREYADQGVALVDAVEVVNVAAPSGIAGREAFYEHVHLTEAGNRLIALAIAEQVATTLPEAVRSTGRAGWASAETVAERLALTDWNRRDTTREALGRLLEPPFTEQLDHVGQLLYWREQLNTMERGLKDAEVEQARAVYEAAVAERPDDPWIYRNYAEFLEAIGKPAEAIAQWEVVSSLLPHRPLAFYQQGRLHLQLGDLASAEFNLRSALGRRADFPVARADLGRVYRRRDLPTAALEQFDEALRLDPGMVKTYVARADALAVLGRREEGIEDLRRAIELEPLYWQARYLLGVELASDQKVEAAKVQFEKVVELKPDYALAHLNLGVALMQLKQPERALHHFREVVKLDPGNQQARWYVSAAEAMLRGEPVPEATAEGAGN